MFSASSGTLSRSEPPRSVKKKVTFKRTGFDHFVKIGITDFLSRYRYATTTAPSHYPIANATHRRYKLIMDVKANTSPPLFKELCNIIMHAVDDTHLYYLRQGIDDSPSASFNDIMEGIAVLKVWRRWRKKGDLFITTLRDVLKDQNYPGCLTYDFVRNFRNICQVIIDHHDQYKQGEQDQPKHPAMYFSEKNINNRAVQGLKASEQSVWRELQYTENRQKQRLERYDKKIQRHQLIQDRIQQNFEKTIQEEEEKERLRRQQHEDKMDRLHEQHNIRLNRPNKSHEQCLMQRETLVEEMKLHLRTFTTKGFLQNLMLRLVSVDSCCIINFPIEGALTPSNKLLNLSLSVTSRKPMSFCDIDDSEFIMWWLKNVCDVFVI